MKVCWRLGDVSLWMDLYLLIKALRKEFGVLGAAVKAEMLDGHGVLKR